MFQTKCSLEYGAISFPVYKNVYCTEVWNCGCLLCIIQEDLTIRKNIARDIYVSGPHSVTVQKISWQADEAPTGANVHTRFNSGEKFCQLLYSTSFLSLFYITLLLNWSGIDAIYKRNQTKQTWHFAFSWHIG